MARGIYTTTVRLTCPVCETDDAVPFAAEVVGRHGPDSAEREGPCEHCGATEFGNTEHAKEAAAELARSYAEEGGR